MKFIRIHEVFFLREKIHLFLIKTLTPFLHYIEHYNLESQMTGATKEFNLI
jgi:hypothetical protein